MDIFTRNILLLHLLKEQYGGKILWKSIEKKYLTGPVRESNPGPLAPKARIMPLDQQAFHAIFFFV